MAPTSASTVVDRPAAEVFAYATDPAHFPEWQQGVLDGHLDPPGPAHVGAKCVTTRRIGGADRTVTSELTHIDAPGHGACGASTDPSGPPSTSPWNRWPKAVPG